MPLVWELTAEIKNWLTASKLRELNEGWLAQGGGCADVVIEYLISMLERPDVHYEAILGSLEVQYRRPRSDRVLTQQYHALYAWLVELVYNLLYYRQVNSVLYLDRHLSFYDGIGSLAKANMPLWIFSLNHDVMIEAVAARLSIPIHSGFGETKLSLPRRSPDGKKIGELRAQILSKHEIEHRAMYFPNPPQSGIYLLKIHGALDVFSFNDGKDLLKLIPDGPNFEDVIEALKLANTELFYPLPEAMARSARATNEIIYADESGEMQFLRRTLLAGSFKFDERGGQVLPKEMLEHFKQNINFVTHLKVIGYGFGDLLINKIMKEWLEFFGDRSIEIVTPISQEVPSFLLHLREQVKITTMNATDYLDAAAGISRSRSDKIWKRVAARARSEGPKHRKKIILQFLFESMVDRLAALAQKIGRLGRILTGRSRV